MRRGIGRLRAGGGGATLPVSGALGIWYMADYSATPTPYIPNRAVPATASSNLLRCSRRLFSNTNLWGATSVTVVDDAVAGPDAVVDASTLVAAANWKLVSFNNSVPFPAGTYKIAINAKSNSGSNEVFGFTKDGGVSSLATETATTTWQRFSRTMTLAGSTSPISLGICSPNGATGTNIAVRDLEIYAGSVDLGPATPDGNLYLGFNAFDPITNSGGVQGTSRGYIQFATASTPTEFTVQAIVRKTLTSGYAALLSKIQSFTEFFALTDTSGSPVNPLNWGVNVQNRSSTIANAFQYANWWDLLNLGGYHVLTFRRRSGVMDVFLDDVRIFSDDATVTAPVLRDLYFAQLNALITDNQTFAGALALYSRAMTDTEVRSTVETQKTLARRAGVNPTGDSLRVLAWEGDSITANNTNCYPWLYCANDNPQIMGSLFARAGDTLAMLSARASLVDGVIPPSKGTRKFILSALIGANDLGSYAGGAAQYITDLRAYCVARAAAGWDVCLSTILPIDGDATFNGRRATVNTDIRTNWSLYGMASAARVIDYAADGILGPDNSRTTNPTYWSDVKHPSDLGEARMETIYRPVINAI